jgi:hypothetical protein
MQRQKARKYGLFGVLILFVKCVSDALIFADTSL